MSLILPAKKKLLMAQKGGADISELFNTSLWAGTGAARTITTDIDSDEGSLVWITQRNQSYGHYLFDTVRGATKWIASDKTNAESTNPSALPAFSSAGYSLGGDAGVNGAPGIPTNYVGWQFRRAEKFFDIVQYTGDGVSGRQIAHSLKGTPGLLIIKRTNTTGSWLVRHRTFAADTFLVLNTTQATASSPQLINSFNNDTFTIGNNSEANAIGNTYIAYIFAHDPSPEGLIQCGSYVGNGSEPGPVVDLGWRPQYLMIKAATRTSNWQIIDATRGFTSGNDAVLYADTVSVEAAGANLVNPDTVGFQLSSASSGVNTNGQTYIYMAIREAT